MRKLILFVLLIASFGATAQNQDVNPYGGIYYNDHSNYRMFGADVLVRSDRATAEARTDVIKGDHLYDTLTQDVLLYNGSTWVSQNNTGNCACIKEASLTIATADVLTLNSAPIEIVAAPGAGYAIEVLSAVFSMTYNSIPYATNTTLQVKTSGASSSQIEFSSLLLALGADVLNSNQKQSTSSSNMGDNAALNLTVKTGNPTAGNSDIKVYVTYRIIEL